MDRSSRFHRWLVLFFLGAAYAQWRQDEKDPMPNRDVAGTTVTVSFKPGKLGINADWNTGKVIGLDKGGQGEVGGVKILDVMKKVDGRTYTERLLDKRIGGSEPFEIIFFRPPPEDDSVDAPKPKVEKKPVKKHDPDDPPKPDFKYATELNETTFKELVYKVTNGTDGTDGKKPPYYPYVMFHMSWCKHCRHALPEFENAAKKLDEAAKANKAGQNKMIRPRFFLIECDGPAGNKEICDMYGHSTYPVIKLFRDGRAIHFNRPRMTDVLAWFANQVSRPPVIAVASKADVESFKNRGMFFTLHTDGKDNDMIKDWADIALDNIQEHSFAYVNSNDAASNLFLPAPSVNVDGEDLEPLPLQGPMNRQSMADWVNFNQFRPVEDLSWNVEGLLRKSGYPVIVFAYNAAVHKEVQALEKFEVKAKQLRKNGKYLFAGLDISGKDNKEFAEYAFPLLFDFGPVPGLSPKKGLSPRIIAFETKGTYWENPVLTDASQLSMESIADFLKDDWNFHDGTYPSMVREKGKMLQRYATGGVMGMAVTVAAAILFVALLYGCVACTNAVLSSDDDADDDGTSNKKHK